MDKLLDIQNNINLVRKVIYVDPTGMRSYRDLEWLQAYADLLRVGEELDCEDPEVFNRELNIGEKIAEGTADEIGRHREVIRAYLG